MIEFQCGECGEGLEAPESMVGEKLQCPNCKYPEKVPESQGEPAKIELEPDIEVEERSTAVITSFESETNLETTYQFERPLLQKGQNATRIRTFHTRLSDKAMTYLDEQINEWIDKNPDIEVKFSSVNVGKVEGKKIEDHLIITVWY